MTVHLRNGLDGLCGAKQPARLAKYPRKVTCKQCLNVFGQSMAPLVLQVVERESPLVAHVLSLLIKDSNK